MPSSLLRAGFLVIALAGFAAQPLHAESQSPQQYENLLTPLLESSTTILGQPLAYPTTPAKITAAIVTIPPGGATGWHEHEVPLFAYILDGALTVDYGEKGIKVYETGGSVIEAIDWPHNGMNKGAVPVRLLAVYMGAEGLANTEAVAHPAP